MADNNNIKVGIEFDTQSARSFKTKMTQTMSESTKGIQDRVKKARERVTNSPLAKKAQALEQRTLQVTQQVNKALKDRVQLVDKQLRLTERLNKLQVTAAAKMKATKDWITSRPQAAKDWISSRPQAVKDWWASRKEDQKNNEGHGQDRGGGSWLGRKVKQGAAAIPGAVVAIGTEIFKKSMQEADEYRRNLSRIFHLTESSSKGFDEERLKSGTKYGYSMTDAIDHAATVSRQTGGIYDFELAQQYARATGSDVGEIGGIMGSLRHGGTKEFNGNGPGARAMKRMFTDATKAGFEQSRATEYMGIIAQQVETAGGHLGGVVDAEKISGMMTMLARGGVGLQGQRGAAVFNTLDQNVRGVSGEARAIAMAALGFGPGGNRGFVDVEEQLDEGLSGPRGAETFRALMSHLDRSMQGSTEGETVRALQNFFGSGVSRGQLHEVYRAYRSGGNVESAIEQSAPVTVENVLDRSLKLQESFLESSRIHAANIEDSVKNFKELSAEIEKLNKAVRDIGVKVLSSATGPLTTMVEKMTETVGLLDGGFKWFKSLEIFKSDPRDEARGRRIEDTQDSAHTLRSVTLPRLERIRQEGGTFSDADLAEFRRAQALFTGIRKFVDLDRNWTSPDADTQADRAEERAALRELIADRDDTSTWFRNNELGRMMTSVAAAVNRQLQTANPGAPTASVRPQNP